MGLAEDEEKIATEEVQEMTNDFSSKIDKIVTLKEKEVLTV
jgi:ribosome recycling factor